MITEDKIKQLFTKNDTWSVNELAIKLGVSKQRLHIVLKRLIAQGLIEKYGLPPKTIYKLSNELHQKHEKIEITKDEKEFLKKEFLLISETGNYLEGIEGFDLWCHKRKLPLLKTLHEYRETRLKYEKYVLPNGLIDGTDKLKSTTAYKKIYLNKLYYLDFYAIERFGKTKLGTILHYAKQGQNIFLMKILMQEIKARIESFIIESKVGAIAFVPPTIKREVQIMKHIQNGISSQNPILDIKKISGIIPVPQKSLNKIEERISNAENTFAVFGNQTYNSVLLIDDAVGSGATLNMIAKKILDKKIAKKVIGLAVVGSFKGFDVITDV